MWQCCICPEKETEQPEVEEMAQLKPCLSRQLSRSLSTSGQLNYKDDQHGHQLLKGLQAMREQDLFYDITLSVEDKEIPAHRLVLAAFSPYFAAMFGPHMKEGTQSSVTLPDQKAKMINMMIDFAYTGEIQITGETVEEMLYVANFLGAQAVQDACCKFLGSYLDESNCFSIMQLADNLGCTDLKDNARNYGLHHLADTIGTDAFRELPAEELESLLADEYVCQEYAGERLYPGIQERKLCEVLLDYMKYNSPGRQKYLPVLLRQVRLPLLSKADLKWLQSELSALDAPQECLHMTQKLMDKKGKTRIKDAPEKWTLPRLGSHFISHESDSYGSGGHQHDRSRRDKRHLEDTSPVHVTGMKVTIRSWDGRRIIGGLRVFYSDGNDQLLGSERGAEGQHEFQLSNTERITHIDLRSGWYVDAITCFTTEGRTLGPYGGPGGGARNIGPPAGAVNPFLTRVSSKSMNTQNDLAVYEMKFNFGYYKL